MSLPIKDRAKQFYATTTLIGLTFLIGKNINLNIKKNSNYKAKMLLQIHDELVFETPQDELEKIIPIIKNNMSDASSSEHHKFNIPLTVDINSGNNWDEAH